MRSVLREGMWAMCVSAGGLVLAQRHASPWLPGTSAFTFPYDHHKYLAMAQHPFAFHLAPYCWRIGVPLLASLLPFGVTLNFWLISACCIWATGVVLYVCARSAGCGPAAATTGVLLYYSMWWATTWLLSDFWLPDGATFLALSLLLLAALRGQFRLYLCTLLVGAFLKETVLLYAPLWYLVQARRLWDPRLLRETILGMTPALLATCLLRLGIPAWNESPAYVRSLPVVLRTVQNGTSRYDFVWLLRTVGWSRLHHASLENITDLLITSYGTLPLLLFAISCLCSPYARRLAPLVPLVLVQLLVAVDRERLAVAAFPVVVLCDTLVLELGLQVLRAWFGAAQRWRHIPPIRA